MSISYALVFSLPCKFNHFIALLNIVVVHLIYQIFHQTFRYILKVSNICFDVYISKITCFAGLLVCTSFIFYFCVHSVEDFIAMLLLCAIFIMIVTFGVLTTSILASPKSLIKKEVS